MATQYEVELEAVLFEYIERYGLTDAARELFINKTRGDAIEEALEKEAPASIQDAVD